MRIPRLLVSALRGGAGKTLLSLGLARALTRQGYKVKPCKKGPDYIDAAWLARAAHCACTNLDPFFLNAEELRALLAHVWQPHHALALIEGNRGLFDGRDVHGSCSSAELARILDAPVLLSLDITKMTRTSAAVVAGLASFEPDVRLAGVVLNQAASSRHETIVRRSLETYTDIPVLGALPRLTGNPLPERHMGLVDVGEHPATEALLDRLADTVTAHTDLPRIRAVADAAPALNTPPAFWPAPCEASSVPPVRIGYVRDAALWFYYAENFEALRRAGAELVELSLLDPRPWPEDLAGLYLGGGFPEEWVEQLSGSPHLAHIRALSEAGLPIYAECGGFMLLSTAIVREQRVWPMSGVFPVRAHFYPRPQGLGYVEARVTRPTPFHPQGSLLRGHEFHYSRCEADENIDALCSLRLESGVGMGQGQDGLLLRNTFAAYTHLYAPSTPHWAPHFVALARRGL